MQYVRMVPVTESLERKEGSAAGFSSIGLRFVCCSVYGYMTYMA